MFFLLCTARERLEATTKRKLKLKEINSRKKIERQPNDLALFSSSFSFSTAVSEHTAQQLMAFNNACTELHLNYNRANRVDLVLHLLFVALHNIISVIK